MWHCTAQAYTGEKGSTAQSTWGASHVDWFASPQRKMDVYGEDECRAQLLTPGMFRTALSSASPPPA